MYRKTRFGNSRGVTLVFVTISLFVILGFAALAIDLGMMFLTKTQLQNAADAAALAGALDLIKTGGDTDQATARAVEFAGLNQALVADGNGQGNVLGSVVIDESDVTFPAADEVRVVTHRTRATGDGLHVYFVKALNSASDGFAEVTATATASYAWKCGSNCLKPFCPPDRWYDANGDGAYNPDPVTNPDEFYDPVLTGYVPETSVGDRILLRRSKGSDGNFLQSWMYPVDFPPINKGNPQPGASTFRSWIMDCRDPSMMVEPGDTLQTEPGMMSGPTRQGLEYLIDQDPGARWDEATKTVENSAFAVSPRVMKIALFNPDVGSLKPGQGRNLVVVVKIAAVFLESFDNGSGELWGRFMYMASPQGTDCDPDDESFLYTMRLIE